MCRLLRTVAGVVGGRHFDSGGTLIIESVLLIHLKLSSVKDEVRLSTGFGASAPPCEWSSLSALVRQSVCSNFLNEPLCTVAAEHGVNLGGGGAMLPLMGFGVLAIFGVRGLLRWDGSLAVFGLAVFGLTILWVRQKKRSASASATG